MRKLNSITEYRAKILVIDDEDMVIDSLRVALGREGFLVDGQTNPLVGIELIKEGRYDVLILDYIMEEMNGDVFLSMVRPFSNIYTILLTGHKDTLPPFETMRSLSIQNYCEKSDNFDQIVLQVEAAIKSMEYARHILFNFSFGDILRMLREKEGYTQQDIADKIGVHRGTVMDYENGNSYPKYEILMKLSSFFRVDLDFLCGRFIH